MFITEHLSAIHACTFGELLEDVLNSAKPELEPLKPPDLLYQTCESLNTSGHLLMLKNKEVPEDSWLVFKKETILAEVNGLLKHLKQCTQLGIVPLSRVESALKEHAQDLLFLGGSSLPTHVQLLSILPYKVCIRLHVI